MMMMSLYALLFLPLISGLKPTMFSSTKSMNSPKLVGSTKPVENFDPLNFADSDEKLQYFREAELKHGRLAMVSALTIPLIEKFTHTPAIYEFSKFTRIIYIY